MKAFMSHSAKDKQEVEAVGAWLKRHDSELEVWIDEWSLVPGDSIVDRINEAISTSDRLVVFLTPDSVISNWVKKEVAAGLVLEAAQKKGFEGENFVIPVYFKPLPSGYSVPPLLAAKLYANFVEAESFAGACAELYRGIVGTSRGSIDVPFDNLEARAETFDSGDPDLFGLRLTFSARLTPERVAFAVDLIGREYCEVKYYFGSKRLGGIHQNVFERKDPTIYCIAMEEPRIRPGMPLILEFLSDRPLPISPAVSPWDP